MRHEEQQLIIEYAKKRVADLFENNPDTVHGFDHTERVAAHAAHIAREEGIDAFIPVLASWLHDIGRAVEACPDKFPQYDEKKTHHELGYNMLRDWFRAEDAFSLLTDKQKLEILYAVRYHWNDEACDYVSAYILRDADKLDGLGEIGLERSKQFHPTKEAQDLDMRLHYEWIHHFKTKTAQKIFDDGNLMEPFEKERAKVLRDAIQEVEL